MQVCLCFFYFTLFKLLFVRVVNGVREEKLSKEQIQLKSELSKLQEEMKSILQQTNNQSETRSKEVLLFILFYFIFILFYLFILFV
jgi:hypothetical protein